MCQAGGKKIVLFLSMVYASLCRSLRKGAVRGFLTEKMPPLTNPAVTHTVGSGTKITYSTSKVGSIMQHMTIDVFMTSVGPSGRSCILDQDVLYGNQFDDSESIRGPHQINNPRDQHLYDVVSRSWVGTCVLLRPRE